MQRDIEKIRARLHELMEETARADSIEDRGRYTALRKEEKKLTEIVSLSDRQRAVAIEIAEAHQIWDASDDLELQELVKQELRRLSTLSEEIEARLTAIFQPPDPDEERNCILELRAGTGGDEAAIWVGDLFRMYSRFIEKQGWEQEIVSYMEGASGGYKEIICTVTGRGAYSMLKYEAGVHRVQRVPATENKGRIQTSTATVAVLPEVDETKATLNMAEVRKDTFCASGPGGQGVNTTYSAVRLTHLPTGLVVSCQDGRSQQKNLEKAKQVLMARLQEKALTEQQAAIGAERRAMVGNAERSEKIRTYNFQQERVTDHRIGYSQQNLSVVLGGELLPFIERLRAARTSGASPAA